MSSHKHIIYSFSSKRMTDERLAEIEYDHDLHDNNQFHNQDKAHTQRGELLQALKVEKKRRKELEEELDQALADVSGQTDRAVVAEYKLAELEAQLAAVRGLPDQWDHEDTGYYAEMRQCAAELREALAGGENA